MACEVEIIKRGICAETGVRIATVKAKYWRGIHAELMTHRVFSRNAASSRAIPTKRILLNILKDMAGPIHWGSNNPGMQAKGELTGFKLWAAKTIWMASGYVAVAFAYLGMLLGMHKQTINRIVEPWSYITVVITSTQWQNFFNLRCHPDAQPEFQELANEIYRKMAEAPVEYFKPGDAWIPYLLNSEKKYLIADELTMIKMSVARCASVSYATVSGERMSLEKSAILHDKLLASEPLHASPAEHQGWFDKRVMIPHTNDMEWEKPELHGNLTGMIQYRKTLKGEYAHG